LANTLQNNRKEVAPAVLLYYTFYAKV